MRRIGCILVPAALLALSSACAVQDGGEERVDEASSALWRPPVFDLDGSVFVPLEPAPVLHDAIFRIRTLGRRCVDAGARTLGTPITLRTCGRAEGQQIRIRELDFETHDVELRAGSYCLGVRPTKPEVKTKAAASAFGWNVTVGAAIELQECNGSSAQRFALDGDAILVGSQANGERVNRQWVLEPQRDFTSDGTPLVVGTRELSDAEYFFFEPTSGGVRPTSGFVRVVNEAGLDQALEHAGWGTVIEVGSERGPVEVHEKERVLKEGVTLRGTRIRRDEGAQIHYVTAPARDRNQTFLQVRNATRITGLRLIGPSLRTKKEQGLVRAIGAYTRDDVIVDRNELSAWTHVAVEISGDDGSAYEEWADCGIPESRPRAARVRVVKSSIHENQMWGFGYGVVVGAGGFTLVQGNVTYSNRHTIAASGNPHDGYVAADNFVLSKTPDWEEDHGIQSDFDMHGSGYPVPGGTAPTNPKGHEGGRGGDYVELLSNTFLQTGGSNFYNRGLACRVQEIRGNVARRKRATGSEFTEKASGGAFGCSQGTGQFVGLEDNRYSVDDPTLSTATGDFDGDGVDDVFVGTGAGWYFSSGAVSEWRFLSRKVEQTRDLRFGDFDGDGRTDVLAVHGAELVISWAGISDWQAVNVTAGTLEDLAVGDFDGDGVADLFYANGTSWYVAPGARNWAFWATSVQRTPNLRFGDFTGDGRTDVLGHAIGGWAIVDQGGQWKLLGPARSTNMRELVVADFDGDGVADVGRFSFAGTYGPLAFVRFDMSKSGTAPYAERALLPVTSKSSGVSGIGRFDPASGTDIVWSFDRQWSIQTGGTVTSSGASRQDMR